jgi:predicted phage baseplate assembly protein
MPLSNATPVIDDRRFADIVDEVRTRIARYTPEWQPVWTDFNDSDPGVTLTHVFAWLAEMLLYRMSKVPDLNYVKFLELIGIELQAATPAVTEITFPAADSVTDQTVIVPPRTQVSASPPEGGTPIVFETGQALIAITARLMSVQAFDGALHRDVTQQNEDATKPQTIADNAGEQLTFKPFGELAPENAALVLGFGYPNPVPTLADFPAGIALDLALWTAARTSSLPTVACGLPASSAYPSATLAWECWNGAEWQKIDLLKDDTLAFTRTGHVVVRTPPAGTMKLDHIGAYQDTDPADPKPPLYWIRARIARAGYETPPQLVAVRTNTVAATQAETIVGEVLGGSNGRRDQNWTLANVPVLKDSLKVQIDDGTGPLAWQIVTDFLGSGPGDLHLVLNRTSGEVRAGDGINGAIPVANPNNPDANVVALEYRHGGGASGNVAAGAIKNLLTPVPGIDNGLVANPFAAAGGRDEETLDEAKRRASQSLRARCRAVTPEDFEMLAREAANIARAKALPLFHPGFPGVQVPGVVTVIVVPDVASPNPTPSEGTLRTVCAYLDRRRLLTTEVYVIGPTYQRVEIDADVTARDDADLAAVNDGIIQALRAFFDPLHGGDDGAGWPFGGTIRFSKVYQRVFTVSGVDSIERLTIELDGETMEDCKDVPIAANALLYSTTHTIDVTYAGSQP